MSIPKVQVYVCLLVLLAGCGRSEPASPPEAPADAIVFQEGERPFGGFGIASAQPSEARLREIAPKVAAVVDFRMPGEDRGMDERAVVEAAGGTYATVGIDKQRLRDPAVRQQAYALITAASKEPARLTWFHCSSGNRAAALWALYRAEVERAPVDAAIADGKAAGLTMLEALVREILVGGKLEGAK